MIIKYVKIVLLHPVLRYLFYLHIIVDAAVSKFSYCWRAILSCHWIYLLKKMNGRMVMCRFQNHGFEMRGRGKSQTPVA